MTLAIPPDCWPMPDFCAACHIELIIQLDLFIDKGFPFGFYRSVKTHRDGFGGGFWRNPQQQSVYEFRFGHVGQSVVSGRKI
jgi:hypothetical protein